MIPSSFVTKILNLVPFCCVSSKDSAPVNQQYPDDQDKPCQDADELPVREQEFLHIAAMSSASAAIVSHFRLDAEPEKRAACLSGANHPLAFREPLGAPIGQQTGHIPQTYIMGFLGFRIAANLFRVKNLNNYVFPFAH